MLLMIANKENLTLMTIEEKNSSYSMGSQPFEKGILHSIERTMNKYLKNIGLLFVHRI